VRVRRHDNDAVTLARQLDVVDEAAAPGDEAGILQPRHGLTNAEFIHAFLLDMAQWEHDARCSWIIGGS
jgi:hypothetical protein